MYFSLIRPALGRERDAAHERVRGPYAEHQWLWGFFAAPPGSQRDFLYRHVEVGNELHYYVVSKRPPLMRESAWRVDTRPYAPKLRPGDRLRFELRANPVVARSDGEKTKRHDVVMDRKRRLLAERNLVRWGDWRDPDRPGLYALVQDACTSWLRSRAARHGFVVDEQCLAVDAYQRYYEGQGRLRFSTVDFTGELSVVDPVAFGRALFEGLGPAKAFGCGLLLVRPIR